MGKTVRLITGKVSGLGIRESKLIQDELIENAEKAIADIYDSLIIKEAEPEEE